jgi:hypothetical protein
MALPSKIKKNIPLTNQRTLFSRREELVEKINMDGTYLPKSLLHADLDGGFLSFVKNELKTIVNGKIIPTVDILITTQNWAQFTETWDLQNIDKNVEPPFITIVRIPEVKYGTNPSLLYTIPNRKQFFYAQVPTWDGTRNGMDVYKIPQPVPVDITYSVKIICNRMREINSFNKNVLEKFSSKQAYAEIKGHYIPIVMGNITDESESGLEKRKYYIQSYEFTMLGFLIDENEFEVSPAITRILKVIELDNRKIINPKKDKESVIVGPKEILFIIGNSTITQVYNYNTNILIKSKINISSFDVYINNNYYGSDLIEIQINNNDILRIVIIKTNGGLESKILYENTLI